MSASIALEPQQEKTFFSVITKQEQKSITDEIVCGRELKFNYINGDKLFKLMETKSIEKENLRYIDILKYNYNQIFLQIAEYFPDIKINKFNNCPCANELVNFEIESCYQYDIYLVLAQGNKTYEYGFDFFDSLNDCPQNKYEHSKTLLDNYEYFLAEDLNSNEDVKYCLNETLFKLMIAICTIKDDEYKLAEILFVKINKDNMSEKILLKELGYFLKIINWKKLDLIVLEDLYDNLELKNIEERITIKEFKKIIKTICDDCEIKFDVKQKDISFEIFELFLLNDNGLSSRNLMFYKTSYQKSMSILMQSLKLIIQLTKEMNMRKKFVSRYIQYIIEFKLCDYKNKNILNNIYKREIGEKKYLFYKMEEQINEYYDKNTHNENKLKKIMKDFKLLCENVFDA